MTIYQMAKRRKLKIPRLLAIHEAQRRWGFVMLCKGGKA